MTKTKTCPHAASGCDYPASECAGHCASKQQPEALRLADVLDLLAMDMKTPRQAAAEQIDEIVALKAQRDELLGALRQAAMWLPILTNMAGLDAEETQVELSDFQDDPSRPPETITIASSMTAARTAIAKAGGAA